MAKPAIKKRRRSVVETQSRIDAKIKDSENRKRRRRLATAKLMERNPRVGANRRKPIPAMKKKTWREVQSEVRTARQSTKRFAEGLRIRDED